MAAAIMRLGAFRRAQHLTLGCLHTLTRGQLCRGAVPRAGYAPRMLRCLEWAARRAASPLAARAARAPAPPAGHLRARLSPTRAYGHSRALGAPHGQPECAGHACAAAPAPMVRAARRLVRGCRGGAAERGAQGSGEDRLPALSAASPAPAPEARGGGPLKCAGSCPAPGCCRVPACARGSGGSGRRWGACCGAAGPRLWAST